MRPVHRQYSNTSIEELPSPFFEFEIAFEIEASTSNEYIQWIQTSLNKILGLQLAVDGIIGPMTRSAIRSFQSKYGLTADGIVGPITEAKLKQVVASQPPGAGTQPSYPSGISPGAIQGSLRNNLVTTSLQEWYRWGQGSKKESASEMQTTLLDYWVTGAGTRYGYDHKLAWSAAFISWVVKKAGGGTHFRYAGAHSTYTYYAIQNKKQQNANPFKAYHITERKPEPGDIIVQNRGGSTFTYDNLKPDVSGTHGDIVVNVSGSQIEVIGGNLSDSVSKNKYSLDANGYLRSGNHFAIIKIEVAGLQKEWSEALEITQEWEYPIMEIFQSSGL